MKKWVGVCICFSWLVTGAALAASEPEVALKQQLAELQTLTGSFRQEVYEDDLLVEEFTGEFALRRPDHLYWETHAPEESLLVADGETLTYYNPFVEQVTLYQQAEMIASNPLLRLLATEDAGGHAEFRVTYEEGYYQVWEPTGDPVEPELALRFNDDGLLSELVLNDGMGQESRFYFSDLVLNETVPAERFQFDIPTGVEVDDQR